MSRPETGRDAGFGRRDVVLACGGALSGALLTTISSALLEDRKARHERQASVDRDRADAIRKGFEARRAAAMALAASFDDLGDIQRRAIEFIATGGSGGTSDVRAVARHFTRLLRASRTREVPAYELVEYYGTYRLADWGERFKALADGQSIVAGKFSGRERDSFAVIAGGLYSLLPDGSRRGTASIHRRVLDQSGNPVTDMDFPKL